MASIAAPAPAPQSSPKAVPTGYLGGAVAARVRAGSPLFSHALFEVYRGIIVGGGLRLRDPRLRADPVARLKIEQGERQ